MKERVERDRDGEEEKNDSIQTLSTFIRHSYVISHNVCQSTLAE